MSATRIVCELINVSPRWGRNRQRLNELHIGSVNFLKWNVIQLLLIPFCFHPYIYLQKYFRLNPEVFIRVPSKNIWQYYDYVVVINVYSYTLLFVFTEKLLNMEPFLQHDTSIVMNWKYLKCYYWIIVDQPIEKLKPES